MKDFFLFLIIAAICTLTFSKLYTNTISITQMRRSNGWFFLDRMSFDAGTALIKFKIKIQTGNGSPKEEVPVELAIIPDQIWEQEKTFQCDWEKKSEGQIRVNVMIKKSSGYQNQISTYINLDHPTAYHFVLRDCQKSIANANFNRQSTIIFNLQMKNGHYQHGSDEHSNKYMLPLLLILTIAMLYFSKGPKHNDQVGQQKDWAKYYLFLGLLFNLISLAFYYLGFLIYTSSGTQYQFFDFMYLLFHSVSEVVLSTLLIFIAYGWTISFINGVDYDLYYPLIFGIGFINLILTLLSKVNDGEHDKYHMYDTIPSYLLIFFKMITVIIFVVGVIYTYRQNSKNGKVLQFLVNFSCVGMIYLISMPAIILFASLLPYTMRKQVVFFSVELIKNFANLVLTWMISSKKSNYSNIKLIGRSFFQEGNKLL